jgi:hypothetical protein
VKVHIESGLVNFLADNWWKMVAIVIAIIVAVILMISKIKGTRVKGYWTISVRINDEMYPVDAPEPVNLEWSKYAKQSSFPLLTMLNDQLPRIITDTDKPDAWKAFFSGSNKDLSKITMKGVWLSSGCVLTNVPKRTGFVAKYAGNEFSGKTRVNCNTLMMTIENGGDTMVLTIRHSTSRR